MVLLGAGASKKSGIPDARETVNRAAKWAWCKEHGRSILDLSVVSSDWQPWLENQSWFQNGTDLADQYPIAIDKLLGIAHDRREFFEHLINPRVPPSDGYKALAQIMGNGWIATVLTTNFDHCLHSAAIIAGQPHHLVEIRTPSDWTRFSISPSHPQLVYVHGSVEHYSDMNLPREVKTLDPGVVEALRPLLRDHPLVVVGYRGMEESIMTDLLYDQCDYTNNFARGVFWCGVKRTTSPSPPPLVQKLAERIGSNFNHVPTEGFDHLFKVELFDQLLAAKVDPRPFGPVTNSSELPADMRPFNKGTYADVDQALLYSRLKKYADKRGQPSPDRINREWNRETAEAYNLLQTDSQGNAKPTLAGWLMFAKNPTVEISHANVRLVTKGPEGWLRTAFGDDADLIATDVDAEFALRHEVTGTLWSQLNVLIETTSLLNQPFVLKEARSRQVTPYHPQALKEMIVNALVHRDYQIREPIDIVMTAERIETTSPGGLTDEVAAKTGGRDLEALIRDGSRGELKGYRNPAISDLFYGGSEMDRKGSGLSDMWRKTADNNGDVTFGPSNGNRHFRVVISARPEAVDEITRTAVADQSETVRFTTNVAEFVSLPDRIWHAGTMESSASALRRSAEGLPVPPGYIHDSRFFSFYDLAEMSDSLVTPFDVGDVEELSIEELFKQGHGLTILRKLLHDCINEHLRAIGLVVDEERRRAHFPRAEEPNRKLTYRGRVKRATRTVVKARTKRNSDEIIYFEHKAFTYSISPFGVDWGFVLNPGYVFTRNGVQGYIGRERTNVLSTKRAARDFNMNVVHDLAFWMAWLSGETEGVFALRMEDTNELTDFAPTILMNSSLPSISFNSAVFDGSKILDGELDDALNEVDDELEELATQVEEENLDDTDGEDEEDTDMEEDE